MFLLWFSLYDSGTFLTLLQLENSAEKALKYLFNNKAVNKLRNCWLREKKKHN